MNVIFAYSNRAMMNNPKRVNQELKRSNFDNICVDFSSICYQRGSFDERYFLSLSALGTIENMIKKCSDKAEETDIKIISVFSPGIPNELKRHDFIDLQKEFATTIIKQAYQYNYSKVLVPSLVSGIQRESLVHINRRFYLSLVETAKKERITILIENSFINYNGHFTRGFLSDAKQAADFIDDLNGTVGEEIFGFCMNVGNCTLCGIDMHEFAVTLGSRLKNVIVRDCDGKNNISLIPFTSVSTALNTDWKTLINGLREIEYDGDIVFDISSSINALPLLREDYIKLLKSSSEYLIRQIEFFKRVKNYDHVVLFGAGNMFTKYMELYSQNAFPEYVCDNNKSLWGKIVNGVEVRSPESLKQLDGDCIIIICNVFYCSEIEMQIRDMGINNNIDFFIE